MSLPSLILASSSPYRREILSRLGLAFESISPDCDESALPGETAEALVKRLSEKKARAIALDRPNALIIGSDQVAIIDDLILTKPGNHANAVDQLQQLRNRKVTFLTGLCLLNSHSNNCQVIVEPFTVNFLDLSDKQIENYLQKEKPYDCAGSFKSEGLGITLFSSLNGADPNSLIGLPLIALTRLLREEGIDPLLV